ncbi:hypothetical protein PYCCODRAFT_1129526 [Trametes coccinea BRFM310]|uniref:Uncharacterized protein n=1 Tax=Trametes coccinea (strain BRFM310) TaxID=1353009 RepID=A0A1Y2IAR8_TRAC3|nr:hypothetical protein PYCCODRAFT_1129526 [Trametes coccinea BRFM310]
MDESRRGNGYASDSVQRQHSRICATDVQDSFPRRLTVFACHACAEAEADAEAEAEPEAGDLRVPRPGRLIWRVSRPVFSPAPSNCGKAPSADPGPSERPLPPTTPSASNTLEGAYAKPSSSPSRSIRSPLGRILQFTARLRQSHDSSLAVLLTGREAAGALL